jgi:hypothetical protein
MTFEERAENAREAIRALNEAVRQVTSTLDNFIHDYKTEQQNKEH